MTALNTITSFLVDITGCGGYLSEDEGIIISPNWPNPYEQNQVSYSLASKPTT